MWIFIFLYNNNYPVSLRLMIQVNFLKPVNPSPPPPPPKKKKKKKPGKLTPIKLFKRTSKHYWNTFSLCNTVNCYTLYLYNVHFIIVR